jgi:hypothetical protein
MILVLQRIVTKCSEELGVEEGRRLFFHTAPSAMVGHIGSSAKCEFYPTLAKDLHTYYLDTSVPF